MKTCLHKLNVKVKKSSFQRHIFRIFWLSSKILEQNTKQLTHFNVAKLIKWISLFIDSGFHVSRAHNLGQERFQTRYNSNPYLWTL